MKGNLQKGTFGNVWRYFCCPDLGVGCYWHVAGRGLGCCRPCYNTQDSPLQKTLPQPRPRTPRDPTQAPPDLSAFCTIVVCLLVGLPTSPCTGLCRSEWLGSDSQYLGEGGGENIAEEDVLAGLGGGSCTGGSLPPGA